MLELTFNELPQAVTQLFCKLENIERLLTDRSTQPQPETERWFNLLELCQYLPDKPVKPTVYGWVNQRAIPFHKKGKKLYFLKSEVDTWLRAGRKRTNSETESEAQDFTNRKRK